MWSISYRYDYNFLNYLTYCAVLFSINLQFYYHDGVFPFFNLAFFMKIFSVRQTVLPALLVLSPVVFAADEQTMIVSAAPQVVSELDTPAAVSVVDGEEMRLATPRINLSESLTGVPGLQVQNRQNPCARFTAVDSRIWLPLHLRNSRYSPVCGRYSRYHARRTRADI